MIEAKVGGMHFKDRGSNYKPRNASGSSCWKRQGNGSTLRVSERKQSCWHLDCSPLRLILDSWSPNFLTLNVCFYKPWRLWSLLQQQQETKTRISLRFIHINTIFKNVFCFNLSVPTRELYILVLGLW